MKSDFIHDDISFMQFVIPGLTRNPVFSWIPDFAGMTAFVMINVVVYRLQIAERKDRISNFELRTPNFKTQSGITLIEVILVMVIIGILSAVVIPRFDIALSSRTSVEGAASMIASDIRYVQESAMANRISKSVVFASVQPIYTFPATIPSTSNLDPSGRLPTGVTITNNFTVTFNSLGEPTTGGGGSVTVTSGTQTKTISIVNYTGKVNIS